MPDPQHEFWRVESSPDGSDPWEPLDKHGTLDGAIMDATAQGEQPGAPQFRVVHNDGGTGGVGGVESVVWP
jgi:hypothetical protein